MNTHDGLLPAAAGKMDDIYRFQRFIYDPSRRFFLLGRVTLLEELQAPEGARILEIGCGTGWNLVRAAKLYPQARLFGLDVSPAMLATARRSVSRAGRSEQISLAAGDATRFDAGTLFGVSEFDRILVSYALSMIPDWPAVLECASRALAPGGSLHIVDFGPCYAYPKLLRQGLYYWLSRFSVTPVVELWDSLNRFAQKSGMTLHFSPLYGGYAVHAILRRD